MAEQEIYGSRFTGREVPLEGYGRIPTPPNRTSSYPLHHAPNFSYGTTTSTLGLIQSTVLPSFNLHASLAAAAYGLSRYTDRVEGKDWLWPASITANAWWNAVGTHVVNGHFSIPGALSRLDYSQKLLLGGVSAWGIRLFYRIVSRSAKRGGDDPRYTAAKKDEGFWNMAPFSLFLPEAVIQTLIGLPFTLAFAAPTQSGLASPPVTSTGSLLHSLAVFLFSASFFLEAVADYQLESHKKSEYDAGILRQGVWSIVRHPNYLGDALIHASFSVLLLSGNLFHPLAALGPVANYVFLRFVGGDMQNEQSQEERYAKKDPLKAQQFQQYQHEVNSFWPDVNGLTSKWGLIAAAAGVTGVVIEKTFRAIVF